MRWQRRLAGFIVTLALTGCAPVAVGPGQTPNAPISSKAILATLAEYTDRRAGQRAPARSLGQPSRWC